VSPYVSKLSFKYQLYGKDLSGRFQAIQIISTFKVPLVPRLIRGILTFNPASGSVRFIRIVDEFLSP